MLEIILMLSIAPNLLINKDLSKFRDLEYRKIK